MNLALHIARRIKRIDLEDRNEIGATPPAGPRMMIRRAEPLKWASAIPTLHCQTWPAPHQDVGPELIPCRLALLIAHTDLFLQIRRSGDLFRKKAVLDKDSLKRIQRQRLQGFWPRVSAVLRLRFARIRQLPELGHGFLVLRVE